MLRQQTRYSVSPIRMSIAAELRGFLEYEVVFKGLYLLSSLRLYANVELLFLLVFLIVNLIKCRKHNQRTLFLLLALRKAP